MVTYRSHDTDYAFFEQTGIDVICTLAAACLFDDERNKRHH